jgi:DNA-binding CsgD family transcriptional regulator
MLAHLNKLLSITQHLAEKPTLANLAIFLSLYHCPSGEVSRVYFAKIINPTSLIIEAAGGFKASECQPGKIISIEAGRPSGRCVLENEIIFEENNPEYYLKYPCLKDEPIAHLWSTQVSIPINSHYMMQFGRYAKFQEGDHLFYQNLQSLFQIYFTRLGKVSIGIGDLSGKPLTDRQNEILKRMQDGMTNEEIALAIGYSASLVKQESMLIFSKLGISGRKELGKGQSKEPEVNSDY